MEQRGSESSAGFSAEQAALPMERFLTYEQVLKGATRAATNTTHSAHIPETQASHKESKNRVLISVLAVISGQSKLRVITLGLLGKRLLVCLPSSYFEFTRPLQYLIQGQMRWDSNVGH